MIRYQTRTRANQVVKMPLDCRECIERNAPHHALFDAERWSSPAGGSPRSGLTHVGCNDGLGASDKKLLIVQFAKMQ